MTVPVVAIVGRPNVGKSSLFNWLAGRRIAIVDPTAGVTRDRVSTLLKVGTRFVELVDTGGMGVADVDNLTEHIERQIAAAIDQAHVILFVVDGRSGVMGLDEEVARRLRNVNKPVLCVANKCDTEVIDPQAAEFYKLGRGKLVCVSAQQNRGREGLLAQIKERLPAREALESEPKDVALKLAIVGRRNTGKSTFINSLAESERIIVSEVPGTTRDSIDVRFERDGKTFLAIDTAGVRKKKSIQNDIEFYSLARAERSIRRADVVLLFFDPRMRVSKVDKQLADYILEQHKPAIFVVNKWDLMVPMPTGKMGDYIRSTFPSLDFVPIAFITAKAGKNVHAVLNLAQHLHKQASARVDDRRPQPRAPRRPGGVAAADAPEPPAEDLLRHASQQQSAHHRPVHQRTRAVRQHLSALSHQDDPRSTALQRRADQAVPAAQAARGPGIAAGAGRSAGRGGDAGLETPQEEGSAAQAVGGCVRSAVHDDARQ